MKKSNDNLISLCGKDFDQQQIVSFLKSDDIWEKQIAILSIVEINEELTKLLMNNLTGVDGKVRDAVSIKISELCVNKAGFFQKREFYDIFLDAICDVNPNVCRNIIKILPKIEDKVYFSDILISRIKELINEIEKFDKKNHKLNKKVFNLYWCLEALAVIIHDCPQNKEINEILNFCASYGDYTIREKTAKILTNMKNAPVNLKEKLSEDSNFYVRRIFYDNI